MELDVAQRKALGEGEVVCLTAKDLENKQPHKRITSAQAQTRARVIASVVDTIGEASSRAQGLPSVITTSGRLRASDHRLYLIKTATQVLGLLKVGVKRLFVLNPRSQMVEVEPLCVLDFYVHESCQRQGIGKKLFDAVVKAEGGDPTKMAYDRPSPKFIAFLAKHFGLRQFTPQVNNFVIFHEAFTPSRMQSAVHRPSAGGLTDEDFALSHDSHTSPPSSSSPPFSSSSSSLVPSARHRNNSQHPHQRELVHSNNSHIMNNNNNNNNNRSSSGIGRRDGAIARSNGYDTHRAGYSMPNGYSNRSTNSRYGDSATSSRLSSAVALPSHLPRNPGVDTGAMSGGAPDRVSTADSDDSWVVGSAHARTRASARARRDFRRHPLNGIGVGVGAGVGVGSAGSSRLGSGSRASSRYAHGRSSARTASTPATAAVGGAVTPAATMPTPTAKLYHHHHHRTQSHRDRAPAAAAHTNMAPAPAMHAVGIALAARPPSIQQQGTVMGRSLVQNRATQRIGRHGVRFQSRR